GRLRTAFRASARLPEPDMVDVSAPAPPPATRFEIRLRLEPRDYMQLIRAVRCGPAERIIAWLAVLGVCGIWTVAALGGLELLGGRLPGASRWDWGPVAAIAGALVGLLVYKVALLDRYVDSMFRGQPIGMGESTIVADVTGVNATVAGIVTHVPWNSV